MDNLYDLIVIGAGPAGLSAAIYAGRAKLKTLVVEGENAGGQIRITSEVVNYPGILKTSGAALVETMKKQAKNFGVSFVSADVSGVDLKKDIKEVSTSAGVVYRAVSVLAATGARPRSLGFEGEKKFAGRGVAYCATCDGEFFTGMDVFVIGAGFAAAEEAIFLTRFAKKVTVIVRKADFACSKTIADQVLRNKKIEVRFNTELLALTGDDVPKKARFVNNATKEEWEYETADPNGTFGVFVFVGYEPVSDLFKGQLTMDEQGYIVTDEDMKTNLEGVYAAGDIRPKRLRQLVTAVSDGAISATSIEKFAETKKEHLGITIEPPAMKEAGEHSTQQAAKQETGQAAEQGAEQGAGFAADASAVESFIDDDIKEQLAPVFEKFEHPVKLALISAENNALTNEMLQFAKDFSALSKNLSFVQYTRQESKYAVDLYPALAILKDDGSFAGITYHGVPGGHEFNSFVLALYNTAGPGQQVEPHVMDKIKSINRPINIKVCVSLSCTMCPELVTATQYIAAHNPNISAAMLDISHFPDIKSRYNIMSVPAMIINDEKIVFGKKDISQVLDLLTEK